MLLTDVIPANTSYVPGSATAAGQLIGNLVRWDTSVLEPGASNTFEFRVKVNSGKEVDNVDYAVQSAEGSSARGALLVTTVTGYKVYLPLVLKNR